MSQKSSCLTKPTSQGEHQHHACRQPVPSPKHGQVVQVQPPARKRREQGPSSNTGCAFRGNVSVIIIIIIMIIAGLCAGLDELPLFAIA